MKDLDIVSGTFFSVVSILLITAFIAMWCAIGSDGAVDYCWIEAHSHETPSVHYYLAGHRPWREDKQIGIFDTFDDAVAAAGKVNCSMRKAAP